MSVLILSTARNRHGLSSVGSYNQPFPMGSSANERTAFPWVLLAPQFDSSGCFLFCFQRSIVFVSGRGHSNLMDRASFRNLVSGPLYDAKVLMARSGLFKNLRPDLRLEAAVIVPSLGKPSPPSLISNHWRLTLEHEECSWLLPEGRRPFPESPLSVPHHALCGTNSTRLGMGIWDSISSKV